MAKSDFSFTNISVLVRQLCGALFSLSTPSDQNCSYLVRTSPQPVASNALRKGRESENAVHRLPNASAQKWRVTSTRSPFTRSVPWLHLTARVLENWGEHLNIHWAINVSVTGWGWVIVSGCIYRSEQKDLGCKEEINWPRGSNGGSTKCKGIFCPSSGKA